MTNPIDSLVQAFTEPQVGPPRTGTIYGGQIQVAEGTRFENLAFFQCRIECSFPVRGTHRPAGVIAYATALKDAFSPQFFEVFRNCTLQDCEINGSDTRSEKSSPG